MTTELTNTETRTIGFTPTEFEAHDRGADLMLGVQRDGMAPITAGQELIAQLGWRHGDAPRTDVRRVRLVVQGEPMEAEVGQLTDEQIARVTGYMVADLPELARQRITEHLFRVNSEMNGELTPEVLLIAYRRVPL